MKTLFKISTLFMFLILSGIVNAQTPVINMRIADTTTVFTQNIPTGYIIYSTGQDAVYVCKLAAASGRKISSNVFQNFTQLATGAAHAAVTLGTANGLSLSGQQLSLQAATSSVPGALVAADWVNFNKAYDSVNNARAIPKYIIDAAGDLILGTGNNTVGRLGIGTDRKFLRSNGTTAIWDTVKNASGTSTGPLSSTDWTTFNNKGSGTLTGITNGTGISTSGTTNITVNVDTASAAIEGRTRANNTFVPKTLTITATAPLTIGGTTSADLSTNRTIAINNAAADGSTKGAASFTANDFDATSGNVSIDYANGQAAATGAKGFLTSTDWNTFNGKLTSTLASASIFVGNGSNVATAVAMSSDATMSNTGAVTIANSAVTLAKMANETANTMLGNNTGSAAAPIALTAAQVRTLTTTNLLTQNFENSTADSTNYTCQLSNTPQAIGAMAVSLNGTVLIPTTQYTIIMTNKIRVSVPTSKYDKIAITYNY